MAYTRDDQVDIRVTLDGTPYGASWDSLTGGEGDSNTVKIRVNGKEIDIGGPGTTTDVTVGIQMSDIVAAYIPIFYARRGKGALKVSYSVTDANYNPLVGPYSYTGTLKSCTRPDFNRNNSSPGAASFQIVLSANEDLIS